LLDLRCESDFVAKSDNFKKLFREICLQIAAMGPLYVKEEDIPQEIIEKEKNIYSEQLLKSGKPKEVVDKIIEGKIKSYVKDSCLLSQPWIKDNKKTVKGLIEECIVKTGENILIRRFTRYEI
jgi:elongation factor Ts